MIENYEIVIGLEVHAQLNTNSKIFCPASATFGGDPNSHVDPVTFGLPGALPVLNRRVVDYAIMLGLALNCNIRNHNRFARKHYFYPDLPKGYQISQYEEPICEQGSLKIKHENADRLIGITRIHMEEDAGKNIHDMRTQASLVDLNRAGVPLLEIVTEPDLRTPSEAATFLKNLRQILRFLGISDGNMEEGSMRCDANISLRPAGSMKYGTRAEIKNINSFKFVEKALHYEAARQLKILKEGGTVIQETRLFDSTTETTRSMRGKEGSADYRYFPDPDLPPLYIDEAWIQDSKNNLPKLPEQIRQELTGVLGLSEYDAEIIAAEKEFVDYYYALFDNCKNAKAACNWMTSELFGQLNKNALTLSDCKIKPQDLGALIKLIDNQTISGKIAKDVFEVMFKDGTDPEKIIADKGLKQITSAEDLRPIVQKTIASCADQVKEYLSGNDRLFGFFVGQAMKATQGKGNPKLINDLIKEELGKLTKE